MQIFLQYEFVIYNQHDIWETYDSVVKNNYFYSNIMYYIESLRDKDRFCEKRDLPLNDLRCRKTRTSIGCSEINNQ
jgi:hypothetical protein